MQRDRTVSSITIQCAFLAACLMAYHLLLRWLMTVHGLRLGAVSYKLVPLYAYWRPHLKGWLLVPLGVLGIYFGLLRRTRLAASLSDRAAVVLFAGSMVSIATAVALIDGGPRALVAPLLRTNLEYYGAIDRVGDVSEFLREYPGRSATMPMHAQVHPPGAVLFLWANSKWLGRGPEAAALGIIAFSALSVWVLYHWAGRLGGPGVARRAAALGTLAPSWVLFTATSMDGPFAVPLIATMWLFWKALNCESTADPSAPHGHVGGAARTLSNSMWPGALAGLCAAASALMTYSVTVVLLFCGLAAVLCWISAPWRRGSIAAATTAAVTTFVAAHLALWLATGYDPIAMFLAAVRNSNHIMSGTRHESLGRYLHLVVGNLVVFFVFTGLPCTILWWRELVQAVRSSGARGGAARPDMSPTMRQFLITSALTLLISAAVPVYVLEVERVWMFLVPLVLIPVAYRLFEQECGTGQVRATSNACLLLAVQTVITEVFLTTYW